jgi:hypothetical protein
MRWTAIALINPHCHAIAIDGQSRAVTPDVNYEPTPEDTVGIRDKDGKTLLVLWFGPGWMGSAVTDERGRKRYFRKVTADEVAELRATLRMASHSSRPPKAAVELQH